MVEIRHVLCPVDFSDFSRRALDHAIALAKWYGSRLSVLYVYHVPTAGMALSSLPVAPAAEMVMLSPADREQLRQQLRAFTPADAVKNVPVEFVVAEGNVATEILAEAQRADSDSGPVPPHHCGCRFFGCVPSRPEVRDVASRGDRRAFDSAAGH